MTRRLKSREVSAWTLPGSQWAFWLFLSMLVLSIVVLILRLLDGDGAGAIASSGAGCALFAILIAVNRRVRRKRSPEQPVR
ncbi:hypothetical protein ACIPPM_10450 [Streptomyces sp. NPDC090119]|uniref:hypothetical protein n=1 Tax=Streptomyces sp. NPDC090119 TaxID=3365951 RepID=UPI00380A1132